ncbi:monocarboxylate transporter 13-like [Patiria miniata]|uniref:Major facilitator superfamily (MFS) profile domain-containing protein n=1 Tax=Patiria miniata TaxID=46514 RepID=A0A914BHX4_PATMI|nr:monocarboxylate transporter 13-like [Patiria miniata]
MKNYQEGGWGWVVLFAAFMAQVFVYGNIKALSVLAETIATEYDTDLWLVGWVASMSLAVQLLLGPVISFLMHVFGCRLVMLLGGVMATGGYLLASWSCTFLQWSVFIVGFAGVGSGCFAYPFLAIIASYFKKYYPIALLVANLGKSCGDMLYGPITQVLLDTYGWRWTMMIICGLTFHLVPCAAVAKASRVKDDRNDYRRIACKDNETDVTSDNSQVESTHCCKAILAAFDFAILTDVHFILITLASCVTGFCFIGWEVYVVPHGIDHDLNPTQSSFLPTFYGIGNFVGKVVAAVVLQTYVINARWFMCIGALCASCSFFADPFLTSFASLAVVACTVGSGIAITNTVKFILYRELASDDQLLSMYSWQGLFVGLSDVMSGFASGWLYDVTGSFKATFILLAGLQFCAFIFVLLDYGITKFKDKK